MIILSVVFKYGDDKKGYGRLVRVLEESIHVNFPAAKAEIIETAPPSRNGRRGMAQHLGANTHKLRIWNDFIQQATEPVVLSDCDMMVLHDFSEVFEGNFDIGYMVRTGRANKRRIPYNGGVVFVKPTEGGKRFIKIWKDINDVMDKDAAFHKQYRAVYAGMNQASFGYLMEHPVEGVTLKQFPCRIYDACSEDWDTLDMEKTKIVHIKSKLRKAIINGDIIGKWKSIILAWRDLEERIELREKGYVKRLRDKEILWAKRKEKERWKREVSEKKYRWEEMKKARLKKEQERKQRIQAAKEEEKRRREQEAIHFFEDIAFAPQKNHYMEAEK